MTELLAIAKGLTPFGLVAVAFLYFAKHIVDHLSEQTKTINQVFEVTIPRVVKEYREERALERASASEQAAMDREMFTRMLMEFSQARQLMEKMFAEVKRAA